MPVQQSLPLELPLHHSVPAPRAANGGWTPVLVATGPAGPSSHAAELILERALEDAGLSAGQAQIVGPGEAMRAVRRGVRAPRLVIAAGHEAAARLLRRPVALALERGRVRPMPEGGRLLVTERPEAVLRLSDPVARGREYRRLVNDLLLGVPYARLPM